MSAGVRPFGTEAAAAPHHAHAVMHCNLNTVDVERAAAFYLAVLDLEPRMRSVSTDGDSTFMGLGASTASTTVFLYDRRGPRAAPALELVCWTRPPTEPADPDTAGPSSTAVGYRVADLRPVVARLAAVGAPVERVDGGVTVRGSTWPAILTADPDGVPVEVIEAPPAADDPPTAAFSHERMHSSDLDRTADWFGALGWTVRGRGAGSAGEQLSMVLPEDPTFSLEFTRRPAATGTPRRANTQGLYRMALAVEDVAAAHDALVAGAAIGEVPEPCFVPMPDTPTGGFTVMFLAGPDGAVVELVSRPRSEVRRPSDPR